VREELADVFYFTVRFSQVTGIDLYSALEEKIAKNAEKYPVDVSRGSNRKYDE
jgi:NTP pyrophosphatase (non-canonical NTP hydrolase)